MKASFAEVLAQEATALAPVVDVESLDRWRIELVDRATNPDSAYARVLRPTGDVGDRAYFLERWSDLIATALARVTTTSTGARSGIDPRRMAVSVLAALYGGAILSRVARDVAPLRTSVDVALAPLLRLRDTPSSETWKTGLSVP